MIYFCFRTKQQTDDIVLFPSKTTEKFYSGVYFFCRNNPSLVIVDFDSEMRKISEENAEMNDNDEDYDTNNSFLFSVTSFRSFSLLELLIF